ncbi:PLP-dependent aminotransferase family protein [Paenibacillus fonticola]|uniref:MocR-like pyridoxine biosynthesis transcription factor PdxR n=1 Tax=Paenibacillus fonticola TaxID=379896 RepID=UPI000371A467|nr:PLP-dependent aminotransferase family protein [Paenibacillus fonticola]
MDFILPMEQQSKIHRYKYLALYHALREAINEGVLREGIRLPSTRELAKLYGLSRGSVSQAYDMLHAEGYIQSVTGSGTYVTGTVTPLNEHSGETARIELSAWGRRVTGTLISAQGELGSERSERSERSGWSGTSGRSKGAIGVDSAHGVQEAQEVQEAQKAQEAQIAQKAQKAQENQKIHMPRPVQEAVAVGGPADSIISFCDAGPSLELFPLAEWKSAIASAVREELGPPLTLGDAAGDIELREAIAAHLRRSRGIAADAEQICLFNGSMQAIMLLTQLLLGEGEPAVLEDPCYAGISRAVAACGALAVPAQVDGQGIVPRDWDARLLFVTPGRQYPTGAVLSPARRRELLAWAARREAVIIEDDYDSEFRFAGRPLEPLKALDHAERVVYVGSFSKTMFAALRIGYAVLPRSLIDPVKRMKSLYEPISPARLEQRALARFMRRGEYARHLRRMRRYYGSKYELFCTYMTREAGELFTLKPSDAGLHVYAAWNGTEAEYDAFCQEAAAQGVLFRDAKIYGLTPGSPAACFCFPHLSEEQLVEGVKRMRNVWKIISSRHK